MGEVAPYARSPAKWLGLGLAVVVVALAAGCGGSSPKRHQEARHQEAVRELHPKYDAERSATGVWGECWLSREQSDAAPTAGPTPRVGICILRTRRGTLFECYAGTTELGQMAMYQNGRVVKQNWLPACQAAAKELGEAGITP